MRFIPTFGVVVLLGLAGCGGPSNQQATTAPAGDGAKKPGDASAAEVVARYAGRTLTKSDLLAEFERLPAPSRAYITANDRKKQFVENLVLNDLLYDEGKKQGLETDTDIEKQVNDLRKRLVVQRIMRKYQTPPEITDDQAKKYYDENAQLYSGVQVNAKHILVKDEAVAKEIAAEVKAHPEKFADLAKEKSTDTATASKGGELGMFGQGRMVPEFEKAAFALQQGQISDVVKTQYGYHVIMVTERKEGAQKPFDSVKEQIKATLRNKATQDAVQGHFDELKHGANLQIDDSVLAGITPPTGVPGGAAPMMGGVPGH
ncbi:MAG: peptidylprolyl isomerase [Candidatus Binatia bacterium]